MTSTTETYPAAMMKEAEAARYIGMSRAWLRLGRSRGNPDTPPYVKVSRAGAVRYLRADLDRWIAERHVDPRQVYDQATGAGDAR